MGNHRVRYFSPPEPYRAKASLYLEVRHREGRLLPDEVVKNLPNVSESIHYAQEWRWRERSLHRLVGQLSKKAILQKMGSGSTLKILDLGCGNGWMSNRLAEIPGLDIWAVDLNQAELEQGARLFGREHLKFAFADVLKGEFPEKDFDVIVLAASVQYFPGLEILLASLRKMLNTMGEIHILDSAFYKNEAERSAARRRTQAYYAKIGVPEMARYYNHHLWGDAEKLGAENLNNSLKTRFLQQMKWLAPFPWLRFYS